MSMVGYREAARGTRCDVQRERALEFDESLPTGAFATLERAEADSLWLQRSRCDALSPEDADVFIEAWEAYETSLRAHFLDAPIRHEQGKELLDTLVHAAVSGPRLMASTILSSSEARKLTGLVNGLGADVPTNFVAGSLATAAGIGRHQTVSLVARRRRGRFDVTVGCAVRRRAPLLLVRPAGLSRLWEDAFSADDDLERAFTIDGSPKAERYCRGAVRGGLRALLELDASPTVYVRDGLAAVSWFHRTTAPLAISVRIVQRLADRAGPREGCEKFDKGPRRYRRWPPPAKR